MDPDRARDDAFDALAGALRDRLLAEAGRHGMEGDLHERIRALVDREAGLLDDGARARLASRIAERSFGLGPLEPLLGDPEVDEVMVNGPGEIWVERGGRIESSGARFSGEAELRHAIERILAPLGRRVDEAEPLCDGRLPDGSRINVIVAPLALDGPVPAILLQRDAGGDLAALLRGLATALEERARVVADARSATAQARFTALLVTGLPAAGLALAELAQPGFALALASSSTTALMVVLALALQAVAFVCIRRIARTGTPP